MALPAGFVGFTQVDTLCLHTTVKNTSGVERQFGFLGARGMRLAADEVVTIPGHLSNFHGGGGKWSQRKFKSLEASLVRGSLEIIETPGVHLYDPTNDETKVLALDGGSLGTVDPCWVTQSLSSSSSSGTGP